MRLLILAIGRLKAEERALVDRYLERVAAIGRGLGLVAEMREMPESRAAEAPVRRRDEAAVLLRAIEPSEIVVALDQRGAALDTAAFASRLGGWRDQGRPGLCLVIGGPDGLDETVRRRADLTLAFGAMTWPHQLARVMLAEQVYRALTVLAGHPYHRG